MGLTKWEMETIINFNDAEKTAEVYTCNKALMKKLDNLCIRSKEITLKKEDKQSKTYIFPKKWVKITLPRTLSDETRKKLSENARKRFLQ